MLILTIRSDNPEAEVGLFDGQTQLAYEKWPAHRELSITIHQKIEELLASQGKKLQDLTGVIGFLGPGSFTGLRIGLTVADMFAYGLSLPVVGSKGDDWIKTGIERLEKGEDDRIALPEYGAPVHITQQRR